jgi:hypothetical protein
MDLCSVKITSPFKSIKMKVLQLIVAGFVLLAANSAQSQVSVNVNLGSPPLWGPVGYTAVRYYYLPDVESFYDIQSSRFIYRTGGVWVHRTYLPRQYRSYDLYQGYKVVMTDYQGNTPYRYYSEYRTKYAKGYHGQAQKTFGERPGQGNSGKKAYSNGHAHKKEYNSHGNNARKNNYTNMTKGHGNSSGKKK